MENSIKYGVSLETEPVLLEISAHALDGDQIEIEVINQIENPDSPRRAMEAAPPESTGIGLGLTNVRERLAAHYGDRADARYGPVQGGYKASLAIPQKEDE